MSEINNQFYYFYKQKNPCYKLLQFLRGILASGSRDWKTTHHQMWVPWVPALRREQITDNR